MKGMSQAMFPMDVWVEAKPPHPSAGEMANRMKQFEKRLRRRELSRFLNAEAEKSPYSNSWGRRGTLRRHSWGRRRALIYDLQHFVGFCLARYIIWRETPRNWKRGGSGKPK